MSNGNINSFDNELIEGLSNNPKVINSQNKIENGPNPHSHQIVNLIDENKAKNILFYSKYKYLCCKYGIENIRKNHIDIIIKKVKIKIFKNIHKILKFCLKINHINRLPQNFIINVKVKYNQEFLNKTIEEIYLKFSALPSLEEMINNNYIKKDKTEEFSIFMKAKLIDIIKFYLKSDLFTLDKKILEKKSGINDVILFDFVANNISDYFLYENSSDIEEIISDHNSLRNNDEFNPKNKDEAQSVFN